MAVRRIILVFLFISMVHCDMYTSVQDLGHLFELEEKLVNSLRQYVKNVKTKVETMKKYLAIYEKAGLSHLSGDEDEEVYEKIAGNPLHAYHVIKRFTVYWTDLENQNPMPDWEEVEKNIVKEGYYNFSQFADGEDFTGAMEGLNRIQEVYQIPIPEFAEGTFLQDEFTSPLTAEDCLRMGKFVFEKGSHQEAFEWLDESVRRAAREDDDSVPLDLAEKVRESAQRVYDENVPRNSAEESKTKEKTSEETESTSDKKTEDASKENTANKSKEKNSSKKTKTDARDGTKAGDSKKTKSSKETKDFDWEDPAMKLKYTNASINQIRNALCRDEKFLSESYMSTLNCYYETNDSPYLTIAPMKIEMLFKESPLWLVHDAISEKEIENMKNLSKSEEMVRGLTWNRTCECNHVNDNKIAKDRFLDIEESFEFKDLNYRIMHIAKCTYESATDAEEAIRTGIYGIGGHFDVHTDYLGFRDGYNKDFTLTEEDIQYGERLTTVLFYLSDVKMGGYTVFPVMKVAVKPVKGAALVWYSLKKSGAFDSFSYHAGCPVILGTKWVINVIQRDRNEFRNRPCGLSMDE